MSQANRNRLRSPLGKSLGLLALLALLWAAGTTPVRASSCFFGENLITTYYSSAAHTSIVGICSSGPCAGAGCTGTKSDFVTVRESGLCEVCVP
jgi:hypothetical protein